MAGWRERRDSDVAVGSDRRRAMRALATQYPGCLRELDTLGLHELRRRAQAASRAAAGDDNIEPILIWIAAFHRLMAATLEIKAHRTQTEHPLINDTYRHLVAHPPGGRLLPLVMETLAAHFGMPIQDLTYALFPSRHLSTKAP